MLAMANSPSSRTDAKSTLTRNKSKTPSSLKPEPNEYKKTLQLSVPPSASSIISIKKSRILKTIDQTSPKLKHRDKLTNLVANPKRKLDTNAERNHHNSGMSYATSDLNVIYGDSHHPNHSFVFNEQNFTKESYFKKEQVYEQKLAELREKLAKLKELGTLSNTPPQNVKFLLARLKMSNEAMHAFLNDYVDELRRVEDESRENFSIVKLWFEKQNAEIEQVFQTENRRATNEFLEKRADLKENIRY